MAIALHPFLIGVHTASATSIGRYLYWRDTAMSGLRPARKSSKPIASRKNSGNSRQGTIMADTDLSRRACLLAGLTAPLAAAASPSARAQAAKLLPSHGRHTEDFGPDRRLGGQEAGLFERNGLNVNLVQFRSGNEAIAAQRGGHVDIYVDPRHGHDGQRARLRSCAGRPE